MSIVEREHIELVSETLTSYGLCELVLVEHEHSEFVLEPPGHGLRAQSQAGWQPVRRLSLLGERKGAHARKLSIPSVQSTLRRSTLGGARFPGCLPPPCAKWPCVTCEGGRFFFVCRRFGLGVASTASSRFRGSLV